MHRVGRLLRRLELVHEHISAEVQHRWCLGVVVALAMMLAGSVLGRPLTR